MELLADLRHHIGACAMGGSLEDLREWLLECTEEAVGSEDERVSRLFGDAWLLISESDRRLRSEEDVRAELSDALARSPAAAQAGSARVAAHSSFRVPFFRVYTTHATGFALRALAPFDTGRTGWHLPYSDPRFGGEVAVVVGTTASGVASPTSETGTLVSA